MRVFLCIQIDTHTHIYSGTILLFLRERNPGNGIHRVNKLSWIGDTRLDGMVERNDTRQLFKYCEVYTHIKRKKIYTFFTRNFFIIRINCIIRINVRKGVKNTFQQIYSIYILYIY